MPNQINPDELEDLYARLEELRRELGGLKSGRSWKLARRLDTLAGVIAPAGSWRLSILLRLKRSVRLRARRNKKWRSTGQPVFWLISHIGGGGTERHVRELAAALRSEGVRPVLIRPTAPGFIAWEEYGDRAYTGWRRELAAGRGSVQSMYRLHKPVHAHIHHVMGLPDDLPGWLSALGLPYDWTIHDYFPICPRAHLNRASGTYCGEPDRAGCDACLNRLGDYHGNPVNESITSWRERFAGHLRGARRVFAPSDDVGRRLARYLPALDVLVRPHFETLPDLRGVAARLSRDEPVRVAVLGAIVRIKGCERLVACARDAQRRSLPLEFHVVGTTDRDVDLTRLGNVHISGLYREEEVAARLAAERCHLAFLPSVWPETFMYTLSIAMAAGLYVVCFDLGAQAERLKAWGWGHLLPLEAEAPAINDSLLRAARAVVTGSVAPAPPRPAAYPSQLESYYGFTPDELSRLGLAGQARDSTGRPRPHAARGRAHARLS